MAFQIQLPDKGSKFAKGFGLVALVMYAAAKFLDWLPDDETTAKVFDVVAFLFGTILPSWFLRTSKPAAVKSAAKSTAAKVTLIGGLALLALLLVGCAKPILGGVKLPGGGQVICDETSCTVVADLSQLSARPVRKQQLDK